MKTPSRAKKCIEYIDKIESLLEYYMTGTDSLSTIKAVELKYLRDYIVEISESKKLTSIKIAAKIKNKPDS